MHGKEHHIMWEREWLEGKISKEEAQKRAGDAENIMELLKSMETVSRFEVESYVQKERAWEMLEEKILADKKSNVISMPRRRWMIGVAASFILAIGALFLFPESNRLITGSSVVSTELAQSNDIQLPGGSMVYLNAESEIAFSKKKWGKERLVELEGEAFFEVVKGNRFIVSTQYGTVEVLGTSFNVRERHGRLEVLCKTGKVRVTELSGNSSQTITPGFKTTIQMGVVTDPVKIDVNQVGSWRDGDFDFDMVALTEVLDEFERQFDIKLEYDPNDRSITDRIYNGYFSNSNMGEAIQLICNPMGLRYEIEEDRIRILGN